MYKIAIAGASTLVGRELKEALSESPLAAASFVLLDEDEVQGKLDQVGDAGQIPSRPSLPTPSSASTSHFFAAMRNSTRKHWREALRAGSTVLDLSGALDHRTCSTSRARRGSS